MTIAFKKTIGQEKVKQLLSYALEKGHLSHGYLFEGPRGLGKGKMAKELAAAILCPQEEAPCGTCNSCKQVEAETHAEFRWIRGQEEGKEPVVSVEMIRNLVKDIYLKPYEGEYKVYVVPEADTMTVQAQNALLKTLEEPPDHSVIILATPEPERLLPTILSRCQRVVFRPVKPEIIQAYLEDTKKMPREKAVSLAAFANGIPDRAIEILEDQGYQQQYKDFIQLTESLMEKDYGLAIEKGECMQRDKSQALWVLSLWQEWLRDLHMMMMGGEVAMLIHQNQEKRLRKQTAYYNEAMIHAMQQMMETAGEDIRTHGNLAFIVESLLMNMVSMIKEPAKAGELATFLDR